MDTYLNLLLVVILIALTAFFVATEFAIVKIRSSRINQLVAEGKKGAVSAKKVTSHLDEYLSACQLGITVTAIGLGALGKPTVEKLLNPLFENLQLSPSLSSTLAYIIAFSFITYLHVVIGELAPKTIAIYKAEAITLIVSPGIILFYRIMFPFIWILNGSSRILLKFFGLKPVSEQESAHSEDELRLLLSESYKSGAINKTELKYVNNIFEFDEKFAKAIMIPRTEMTVVSEVMTIEEVILINSETKYTRYPVAANGDKDKIIGFVNIKEIMHDVVFEPELMKQKITSYIQPIIHVIETCSIRDILKQMQKKRTHLSIIVDEYGGTAGLVTIEDILEEIVGEIQDEFDHDEVREIQKLAENHYILNAKVLVEDANNLLGIEINNDDVDTIGGWLLTQKFEIQQNDIISFEHFNFRVRKIVGQQIKEIEVTKTKYSDDYIRNTI